MSTFTLHEYVIVLEDDLVFALDFAAYMVAFLPYLSAAGASDDSRPVCVSGWNDNGASPARINFSAVGRTTYFPGLGWAVSRGLWDGVLRDMWPRGDTCVNSSTSIVGIGWDFWLRSEFDSRGWSCVTPDVPRVFHFGGGGSANVDAAEKKARFDISRLADVPYNVVSWEEVAARFGGDGMNFDANLRHDLSSAVVIDELYDAKVADLNFDNGTGVDNEATHRSYVLLYRREDFLATIASILTLWPTPRGHYHFVLALRMTDGRSLYLVDARRTTQHLLPSTLRNTASLPHDAVFSAAALGVSCSDHCKSLSLACRAKWLEHANDCNKLQTEFGCHRCSYETGGDLPAFAVPNAGGNLTTEGLCLVTESGTGAGGSLTCDSAFRFTRRLCVCGNSMSSAKSRIDVQDEL
jgi:GNT-I family